MKLNVPATLMSIAVSALAAQPAVAQVADDVVRNGVLVDMTVVYLANGGRGLITAVNRPVKGFGGKVLGKPIQVVSADYQNKADIASTKAREWYDVDKVDMIIESTHSSSAIALQKLGLEKKKLTIFFADSASSALTKKECAPYGIHYDV